MNAAAVLLDKAKRRISAGNFTDLALTLGVTRQVVSAWRTGREPIPDDRVTQLARMAGEDAGPWLVALHAERVTGPAAAGWKDAAKRLGAAATVACVALALPAEYVAESMAYVMAVPVSAYYVNWTGAGLVAAIAAGLWLSAHLENWSACS